MYGDSHVMRYILELSCYDDMPVLSAERPYLTLYVSPGLLYVRSLKIMS